MTATVRPWTVDDAVRAKSTLLSWMQSVHAAKSVHSLIAHNEGVGWPGEPVHRQLELVGEVMRYESELLAHEDLVYADLAMTDMIAAAADSFPATMLQPSDFISPHGLLVFAKPLPTVDDIDPRSQRSVELATSAVTWSVREECILTFCWERAHGLYVHPEVGDIFYQGLQPKAMEAFVWDKPCPAGMSATAALRALTALSRQPLVIEDRPRIGQAARGIARKARLDPNAIRRVRLRRPEVGPAELQAAREERRMGTPRGHWVRGHWRDQYYASVDDHRPIWIVGFPRGDFTRGAVTGPKALIANGDQPGRAEAD